MTWYLLLMTGLSCLPAILIAAVSRAAGNVLEPQFNTTPELVKVTEGTRAVLPCSVEFLGQYSVIWVNPRKILLSHNDRRVIDDPRVSVERPFVKEWNLLIRHARLNDSGMYECRINTKPTQIKKVTLVVQVPPVVISELSSDRVVLREGETATLVCNVTGVPPPDVTWYKRNSRQIDGKKERVGEEGSILVISNVTRACDDIYECYVDNGVPPAVTKAIRVIVEYPPEVHLPTKRIGQSVGKETILDCVISAKPQAVTEWRRNGRAVRKSDKHDIYVFGEDLRDAVTLSLRVKKLDESDYGRYVCVGSNHLGRDHEEMVLYEIFTTTTTSTTTTTTTTPATTTTTTTASVAPTPPRNRQGLEYPYGPNGQALADGHVFHSSSPHHGRDKTKPDAMLEDPGSSGSSINTAHGCHLCSRASLHLLIASLLTSSMTSAVTLFGRL